MMGRVRGFLRSQRKAPLPNFHNVPYIRSTAMQ